MAESHPSEFHKCRHSACACTVRGENAYCSEHCALHASSAIRSGQGCECGHAECKREKPPAV